MAINCQITGSGVVVQIADTLACVAVDSFPRERGRRAKALRQKSKKKAGGGRSEAPLPPSTFFRSFLTIRKLETNKIWLGGCTFHFVQQQINL